MVAKKSEGTQRGGASDHSGTLTALGVTVEESWKQVCRCILEHGEEAHSVGVPVVRCFRFGIEGRQTSVCPKHVEPSTCRSWPACPPRVIRHVQKVQCGRGKAFYAAAGGRCARSRQATFLGGPDCGQSASPAAEAETSCCEHVRHTSVWRPPSEGRGSEERVTKLESALEALHGVEGPEVDMR